MTLLHNCQNITCLSSNTAQTSTTVKYSKQKEKLCTAVVLCLFFMLIEISGGYYAHSLAIMSDAIHLLSDIGGFVVSLIGILLSEKQATAKHSFGFLRAEILGALASIAIVWLITIFLLTEAVTRIQHPEPINAPLMFVLSLVGLLVNICLLIALHEPHNSNSRLPRQQATASSFHVDLSVENHTHEYTTVDSNEESSLNLSVRAAVTHAIGDLFQSAGVCLASLVIWFRPAWTIADPICTFIFAIFAVSSTYSVLTEAVQILMEATPAHINLEDVGHDLSAADKHITDVHELHVWTLAPGQHALTAHLVVDRAESCFETLANCQNVACQRYGIHHTVFQLEPADRHPGHCSPAFCLKE